MEYLALKTVQPKWLNLQLPTQVAELLRHGKDGPPRRPASRDLVYLSRGPGIARVLSAYQARDILPIEVVRGRYLATARTTDKLVHSLPLSVAQHLGVQTVVKGHHKARTTDDSLLWFVPTSDYYEFKAMEASGRSWSGPRSGGLARVYLAKGILPLPGEFTELAHLEHRIEAEDWSPRVEGLARVSRARAP